MSIIQSGLSVESNLSACNIKIGDIEKLITGLEAQAQGITVQKSNNETGRATDMGSETDCGICGIAKAIKRSSEIVGKISDINNDSNEIMSYAAEHADHPYAPIIMKRMQLAALRSKKTTLQIKKTTAKGVRDILLEAETGTGSAGTMVIAAPIMVILMAFKALCSLITLVLKAIEKILNLLPKILSVAAQSMCFFLTPRSMKKTDMKVINANQSITDKLPESVKKTILEIQNKQNKLNIPIKVATISAGAAAGLTSIKKNGKLDIPPSVCKTMEYVSAYNVMSSIESLIALLPFAEPLPKYEKLSITNPGFLVWLLTGFVPAGHKSFGIPGMP